MSEPKILIVQDENSPLLVLKKALAQGGFDVVTCNNAFDGLDEMRSQRTDAIVVCVTLPDIDGFQLSSLIKSSEPTSGIPVILVGTRDELADSFWRRSAMSDLVLERKDVEFEEDRAVERIRELVERTAANSKDLTDTPLIPSTLNSNDFVHSYKQVVSNLLMERAVGHLCRGLIEAVNSRVEFMSRFFGFMKKVFGSEVTGLIVVADPHNAWGVFEMSVPVTKSAFDKLQTSAQKALNIPTPARLVNHGETPDKGGASIKAHEIITVHGANQEIVGAIVLGWTAKHSLDEQLKAVAEMLKPQMRPVFKALCDLQQIQTLKQQQALGSYVDAITGLYNIEFLIGFLQQQLLFSARQKLPVGVILIDVDKFADLSQEFGPETADMILMGVANKLNRSIRGSDLLARYSGDTFAIVLPNTDINGSQILAEKLRSEVETMTWDNVGAKKPSVTISVGCAAFNMEDLNPETVLRDAKVALMAAKEAGRNRVSVV